MQNLCYAPVTASPTNLAPSSEFLGRHSSPMITSKAQSYSAELGRSTIECSSFFRERRADALPPPSKIRALNRESGDIRAENFNRPPPVRIPSLGLIVKYGADVTVHEAKTQIMVREKLSGHVPIPEVFGWIVDGGQGFIYMQLIQGDTLQERWHILDEADKRSVCSQLRAMVASWRSLPQDGRECYIGSPGRQPLNDIFLQHRPELVGPFEGLDAVEQFQNACGIDIAQRSAIVFTHADLVAPNIMLSTGPDPTVVAVIDWAQAGWYPSYWEFCKARRVDLNSPGFNGEIQDEWRAKYLPLVLDEVDNETCYYPWLYFVLSKGI
ncbi:hypothetical protein C2857_000295 [Epichloe festucae Fl1]|uniref:Aminoglycoside phosphotransferase domain-containing protein n=1 Tax=Epichloe festucae (strain Fl1) TaxID=877507 RepID=A0A7S9KUB4_EPIFF|nr:hypothetical protein C2857_000295 [Epichloe festucae Fl1]